MNDLQAVQPKSSEQQSVARPIMDEIKEQIVGLRQQIESLLPKEVHPDRFIGAVLDACANDAKVQGADPRSLETAVMKAANDGLLPDGREGIFQTRYNKDRKCDEVQWVPMVQGIITALKRHSDVTTLDVGVVYEGEPFKVLRGDDQKIYHEWVPECVKPGKERAFYAIATLKDGTKEREFMTRAQVEDVRSSSKQPDSPVWKKWYDQMGIKAVIRRLRKRLPSLDERSRIVIDRVDEDYDFGRPAPALLAKSPAEPPRLPFIGEKGEVLALPPEAWREHWFNALRTWRDNNQRHLAAAAWKANGEAMRKAKEAEPASLKAVTAAIREVIGLSSEGEIEMYPYLTATAQQQTIPGIAAWFDASREAVDVLAADSLSALDAYAKAIEPVLEQVGALRAKAPQRLRDYIAVVRERLTTPSPAAPNASGEDGWPGP